mmetsp:Transcript_5248/g.12737  ORF Transcript_5248/g.12737 Transcript_5248/m.12737 type:complete len:741 (-) Transcript_5248:182-2404(-)
MTLNFGHSRAAARRDSNNRIDVEMKPSNSFDVKRKPTDGDRTSNGRASKVQRVWGNQMELTQKEILKLREKENKLNEQLGILLSAYLEERITEGKYGELSGPLKAQKAETQREIQAKETKLEEMTKKFEDATQVMEMEESGAAQSTWRFDEEATEFANELMEAKYETPPEANDYEMKKDESSYEKARITGVKILRLKKGLFSAILGQVKEEKVLVYRPTMQQAMDHARKCRGDGHKGVLIRGPPGTGKSVAIVHASLKEEFDKKRNVVLFSNKGPSFYSFEYDREINKYKSYKRTVQESQDFNDKKLDGVTLICDPEKKIGLGPHFRLEHQGKVAFTVIPMSPSVEFRTVPNLDYVNVFNFSLDQLLAFRKYFHYGKDLDEAEITRRYLMAGGAVRHVFGGRMYTNFVQCQQEVVDGFSDNSGEYIKTAYINYSSKLYTMVPKLSTEERGSKRFISIGMGEREIEFLSEHAAQLCARKAYGEVDPKHNAFSVEHRMLYTLSLGGDFCCRRLKLPGQANVDETQFQVKVPGSILQMNFDSKKETNAAISEALKLESNEKSRLTICSNCYPNWDAVLTGLPNIGEIKAPAKVFRVQQTESGEHNYNPFSKDEKELDTLTDTKVVGLYVVPVSKFKEFTLGHRWTEKNLASKKKDEYKLCVKELRSRRETLRALVDRSSGEEDDLKVLSDDNKLGQKATVDAEKRIRNEIHNKVEMFVIGIDFIKAFQTKTKLPGLFPKVNTG